MKESVEPVPAERMSEGPEFSNRKLIRPSLTREQSHSAGPPAHPAGGDRRERHAVGAGAGGKRTAPLEQTNAENFYYQKQMQAKTPMVVILKDGEKIQGVIEWYDRGSIRLLRENGLSNMVIYKSAIKYMYKESESGR
jgi:sRNA-binding regulator protein Hfq